MCWCIYEESCCPDRGSEQSAPSLPLNQDSYGKWVILKRPRKRIGVRPASSAFLCEVGVWRRERERERERWTKPQGWWAAKCFAMENYIFLNFLSPPCFRPFSPACLMNKTQGFLCPPGHDEVLSHWSNLPSLSAHGQPVWSIIGQVTSTGYYRKMKC
jgi:hypothetical protein